MHLDARGLNPWRSLYLFDMVEANIIMIIVVTFVFSDYCIIIYDHCCCIVSVAIIVAIHVSIATQKNMQTTL